MHGWPPADIRMIDDDIRRPSLVDPGMGPMPPRQSVSMMYACSIVYKSYTVGYFMRRETEKFERSLTKASGRYTAARVFGPWMVAAGEAGTAGRQSRGRGLLWSPIRPDATAIHLLATLSQGIRTPGSSEKTRPAPLSHRVNQRLCGCSAVLSSLCIQQGFCRPIAGYV
jgi:hypothetical protein